VFATGAGAQGGGRHRARHAALSRHTRVEGVDQPHEFYRRKIRIMRWRLERTRERTRGAYADAQEFERDVELLQRLLIEHPSPRVAHLELGRLLTAVQVFGFHSVTLDFRQHSSHVGVAAEEILRPSGLPVEPEEARIKSIQSLLTRRPDVSNSLKPASVLWANLRPSAEFRTSTVNAPRIATSSA